jgi:hypothetical protein
MHAPSAHTVARPHGHPLAFFLQNGDCTATSTRDRAAPVLRLSASHSAMFFSHKRPARSPRFQAKRTGCSTSHSLPLSRPWPWRAPSCRALSQTATSSGEPTRPLPPSAHSPPPPRAGGSTGSNPGHGGSSSSNLGHDGSGPAMVDLTDLAPGMVPAMTCC